MAVMAQHMAVVDIRRGDSSSHLLGRVIHGSAELLARQRPRRVRGGAVGDDEHLSQFAAPCID
jgi:hypothetical protein